MKQTLETRLGLFFALALIAVLIILEFLHGFAFLKQGYKLHALFKTVQELKPGEPVKMAGVRVGMVESISLTNEFVLVTMNLDKDVREKGLIKTDSKAMVKFAGLMGSYFVSIDFGTNTTHLENDQFVQTEEQPDISQIMSKLDKVATGVENLTKSFSGESIEKLVGPVTDFVNRNKDNLTTVIGNMKTVSDNIATGKGTVGKLINEDTLYVNALTTVSNLQNSVAEVQRISNDAHSLLTNANFTVTQINEGKGTVGRLISDDSIFVEARGSLTNLHQILLKINHGEGSVGKLINDESLLKNVKLSLQKLDKATESLEDTGPLSVMGTMVNSLF